MHRERRAGGWDGVAPALAATLQGYLGQVGLTLRPATVSAAEAALREFACFLADHAPEVTRVAGLRRGHIEAYKLTWPPARRLGPAGTGTRC